MHGLSQIIKSVIFSVIPIAIGTVKSAVNSCSGNLIIGFLIK